MTTRRVPLLIAGLALAVALIALPASANDWREVRFGAAVALEGKVVPAGSYTLRWKTDGAGDVRVTVANGGHALGSVTGRWTELEAPAEADSVAFRVDGDGRREIVEIRFGGTSRVIRIDRAIAQSFRAQ